MAGYGLDDSDFDEFLESSSDEEQELPVAAPPLQAALAPPPHAAQHQILLTGTSWRGPACGSNCDACTEVPPSR